MFYFSRKDIDIEPRLLNRYVTADLESIHVIYRSLFDHIALIMIVLSDNPGQFQIESFTKQRSKVKNESFRSRIGDDVFELIRKCDWYDHVRSVRDALVHQGGMITYEYTEDHLLVNVHHESEHDQILPDKIFFNGSIIFEWYAALIMVYLHSYLDSIDRVTFNKLNFVRMSTNSCR